MTMDRHATIGAMLDEYALGQLSQDERRDVERHVRECDLCAADLRDLAIVMVMAIGVFNIGGAGVFYFVAIYISRIIVCLAVGRVIVRLALGDDGTPRMAYFNLAAGVLLLFALRARARGDVGQAQHPPGLPGAGAVHRRAGVGHQRACA